MADDIAGLNTTGTTSTAGPNDANGHSDTPDTSSTTMLRLVRPADFERVLRTRSRASSAHFAVHHLQSLPLARSWLTSAERLGPIDSAAKLSTGTMRDGVVPVDDPQRPAQRHASSDPQIEAIPDRCWLGLVVPKRHARRAVTRVLLKRQIRTAMVRHAAALAHGLWVVRLRSPFDREHFVSAASAALKQAARAELDQLLSQAARGAAAH